MIAITFPGQGSQKIGMGAELAQEFKVAKEVFEEVDEALGEKLSDVMWNGDSDELTKTQNAQPALMAVSIAVLRVMEELGFAMGDAKFVAGHSLGECSSLAAVGVMSLGDTARLLKVRSHAMQNAVKIGEGAMAAIIGLEADVLEKICGEINNENNVCQIANDNGGGQLVISGHTAAVEKAMEDAQKQGAKRAIRLAVSAPFHCVLMESVASELKDAFENIKMHKAQIPIVCNVMAQPISEPDEIKTQLVAQITARVRWREIIEFMGKNNVEEVVEVGSGKVLSGLARRIDKNMKTYSVETKDDMEKFLNRGEQ